MNDAVFSRPMLFGNKLHLLEKIHTNCSLGLTKITMEFFTVPCESYFVSPGSDILL